MQTSTYLDSIEYYTFLHGTPPSDTEKLKLAIRDKATIAAVRDIMESDSMENFRIVLGSAINEYVLSNYFQALDKPDQREELFNLNCMKSLLEKLHDQSTQL